MSLRSDCEGIVPDSLLPLVPLRYDIVGDIAILSLPDPLIAFSDRIALAVTFRRKNIRTILRKVTKIEGERRVARFEVLTGRSTETIHHESGYLYRLDVTKAFFAPRLASERKRVTSQVGSGESVLVPFAGVGPFSIPAAVKGGYVTAIENNLAAFRFLDENVDLNGMADRTCLIFGDAFNTILFSGKKYDRAIIPAPYGQDRILDLIIPVIKKMGMIHMYTFRTTTEIPALITEYCQKGLHVNSFRQCGNTAPGVSRWVFDLCNEALSGVP